MQQISKAVNQNLDLQILLDIIIRNIPAARPIAEAHGFSATEAAPSKAA